MSSTELAVIDHNDLETIQRTARMLAVSGYFDAKGESPVALAQMAVKILAGRELGFGPFAAVRGIHIIQGAPSVSANLMAAAVKSSRRYDYRVREHTAQVCRIEFFERADSGKWEPVGFSEFSAEDAKRAGTKNMDKYPKNMLFARAMSNGVRFYCPDVFSGVSVYTPEELGADVDADGDVIDATPTPAAHVVNHTAPAPNGAQRPAQAPTEASAPDTSAALKRMHAIGHDVWGADWDKVRESFVVDITGGAHTSSKDLMPAELSHIITVLETEQIAKRTQGENWRKVYEKISAKFEADDLEWSAEQHKQARVWLNRKRAVAADDEHDIAEAEAAQAELAAA